MLAKSILGFVALCSMVFVPQVDDELTGVKCLMNPDTNAKKSVSVDYMSAKVYFSSEKCAKAFEAKPAKYTTKANHQLVLTGQYIQTGCPFTGLKPRYGFTSDVGGVAVKFCCQECNEKVEKATDLATKLDLVFNAESFKTGFVKKSDIELRGVKCVVLPRRPASAQAAVDYKGGKIFMCCKGCVKKFGEKQADFVAAANHQLVLTGQYKQKACPISGDSVEDDHLVTVNGVNVLFSSDSCAEQANEAADDSVRVKMLFNDDAFKKAFEKK